MRGSDEKSGALFSYVDLEVRVRPDHPLRAIRLLANEALVALQGDFSALYSGLGRPSIPPERLSRIDHTCTHSGRDMRVVASSPAWTNPTRPFTRSTPPSNGCGPCRSPSGSAHSVVFSTSTPLLGLPRRKSPATSAATSQQSMRLGRQRTRLASLTGHRPRRDIDVAELGDTGTDGEEQPAPVACAWCLVLTALMRPEAALRLVTAGLQK